MDIKANEYVRTSGGHIGIFQKYEEEGISQWFTMLQNGTLYTTATKAIVKHSKNIIDLIKVGDYVNGYIVLDVMEDLQTGEIHLEMPSSYPKEGSCTIYNDEIQSILTHEQYNANCYKVKGE